MKPHIACGSITGPSQLRIDGFAHRTAAHVHEIRNNVNVGFNAETLALIFILQFLKRKLL